MGSNPISAFPFARPRQLPMRRLHSILLREILPRRYASLMVGLICLAMFLFQAQGLRNSSPPGSRTIPIFCLVMGIAQLADSAARFVRRAKRKRHKDRMLANCCVQCGYPLKGSNSPHCPECGTWHGRMPARTWVRLSHGNDQSDQINKDSVERRAGRANAP